MMMNMPLPKQASISSYNKIKELATNDDIFGASSLAAASGRSLGEGVDREAFLIHPEGYKEPIVLKIDSFYSYELGRNAEQTKNEIKIFQKYKHPYIPKIFDWDKKNFRWLEMEYLKPFPHGMKLPLFPTIEKFSKLINGTYKEYTKREHWGLNDQGEPKLLDLGL